MNSLGVLLIVVAGLRNVTGAANQSDHYRLAMRGISGVWKTEDDGAWAKDCDIMKRWCRVNELEWTTTLLRLTAIMNEYNRQKAPQKLLDCYYRIKGDDAGYNFRAKWVTSSGQYISAQIFFPWSRRPRYLVELLESISNKCEEKCVKEHGCDYCRGESSCDCQRQSNCDVCFRDSGCSEAADRFFGFLAKYAKQCPADPTSSSLAVGKRVLTREKETKDPRKWAVGYIESKEYNFEKGFLVHDGLDYSEETHPYERICPLPSVL